MSHQRDLGRCLIVNAYSYHNAGDAAIMLSSVKLLRTLGASDVAIASRYPDQQEYAKHGVGVVPAVIEFPTAEQMSAPRRLGTILASAIGCWVSGYMKKNRIAMLRRIGSLLERGKSYELLNEVDTLVIAGGGYMYSSKRAVNLSLWHSLACIRAADTRGIQTLMMPQSIGPIHKRIDAVLVDWSLRAVNPVVCRERLSGERSRRRPTSLKRSILIPDVAFYPLVEPSAMPEKRSDEKTVRIVAMDWRWSTSVREEGFERYVSTLAVTARRLAQAGCQVVVGGHSSLPEHNQDDLIVADQIVKEADDERVKLDPNTDVAHLAMVYSETDLVVGTRLHSCIMAISVGTPAIAIAYQEKSVGVLESVGISDSVLWADRFTSDELIQLVDSQLSKPRGIWTQRALAIQRQVEEAYLAVLIGGTQ